MVSGGSGGTELLALPAELLGHSTPGFTVMIYVHPSLDMKKKAIAMMNDIINKQA